MIDFSLFDSFNKYWKLGELITRTPFGEVYDVSYNENGTVKKGIIHVTLFSAENAESDVNVRLKLIRRALDLRSNDRALDLFEDENSKCFIKAECYPDNNGTSFLVASVFAKADCLCAYKNIKPSSAFEICLNLCKLLSTLHKRKVVHGAICPTTVFMGGSYHTQPYLICLGYSSVIRQHVKGYYDDQRAIENQDVLFDIYSVGMLFASLISCGKCVSNPNSCIIPNDKAKYVLPVIEKACLARPECRYHTIEELKVGIENARNEIQAAEALKKQEERQRSAKLMETLIGEATEEAERPEGNESPQTDDDESQINYIKYHDGELEINCEPNNKREKKNLRLIFDIAIFGGLVFGILSVLRIIVGKESKPTTNADLSTLSPANTDKTAMTNVPQGKATIDSCTTTPIDDMVMITNVPQDTETPDTSTIIPTESIVVSEIADSPNPSILIPDTTIKASVEHSFSCGLDMGHQFAIGLKSDGTVVTAGSNEYGQCNVSGWKNIVQVAAGWNFSMGLRSDGKVLMAGTDSLSKSRIDKAVVDQWHDIAFISANACAAAAIDNDGILHVVGGPDEDSDQTYYHIPSHIYYYGTPISVSVGVKHILVLFDSGKVIAIYNTYDSWCDVSLWENIAQVAAGESGSVGLTADGRVLYIGQTSHDQSRYYGLSDIESVSSKGWHLAYITFNGQVGAVGYDKWGQCAVSSFNYFLSKHPVAVATSGWDTAVLFNDGTVSVVGNKNNIPIPEVQSWKNIVKKK